MHLFEQEKLHGTGHWLMKIQKKYFVKNLQISSFSRSFSLPRLKVSVAIVLSTEALFVFGAVVAIYHCVAIHLPSARLLGMRILMLVIKKTMTMTMTVPWDGNVGAGVFQGRRQCW